MSVLRMVAVGSLIAFPISAIAEPVSPDPIKVTANKPAKNPDAISCRTIEEMGSLIKKQRICASNMQWKEFNFHSGQWTERMSTQRWLYGGG